MTNRNDSELSAFALYAGPIILGSVTANAMYAVVCHRARVFTGVLPVPVLSLLFAILGGILVSRIKDSVERTAFAIFALYHALLVLSVVVTFPLISWLGYATHFAFSALLTIVGARANPPRAKVVIPLVFLATLILSWAFRYYGDQLQGRESVFNQVPFC